MFAKQRQLLFKALSAWRRGCETTDNHRCRTPSCSWPCHGTPSYTLGILDGITSGTPKSQHCSIESLNNRLVDSQMPSYVYNWLLFLGPYILFVLLGSQESAISVAGLLGTDFSKSPRTRHLPQTEGIFLEGTCTGCERPPGAFSTQLARNATKHCCYL